MTYKPYKHSNSPLIKMERDTYSLRIVTEFLESQNIEYTLASSNVGMILYEHGCRIKLNDRFRMSIQTHPLIAGPAFAETALQDEKTVVYGHFGYNDVIRHHTPEDLFNHITNVLEEAKKL